MLFPSIGRNIRQAWQRLVGKRHPLQDAAIDKRHSLTRLGSEHCGWTFVDDPLLYGSTILSAGLGEDASFDIEFAKKYNARLIIVDPTPRAVAHFQKIRNRLTEPKTCPYTSGGNQPIEAYDLSGITKSQLNLVQKALWKEPGTIDFFKPPEDSHVSHSIINWQHNYRDTTPHIEVVADTITGVIDQFDGIDRDDILLVKLDIEGAEIEVIDQMLREKMFPKQILVEFDELHNPKKKAFDRVDYAHGELTQAGYRVLYTDGFANFLYYRQAPTRS